MQKSTRRSQPFEAPDGYFDQLSGRIQQRIAQKQPNTLPADWWYTRLSLPVLGMIALIISIYFRPMPPLPQTNLSAIPPQYILHWVEQENLYEEFTGILSQKQLDYTLSTLVIEEDHFQDDLKYLEEAIDHDEELL
jgi:hypothetical protein